MKDFDVYLRNRLTECDVIVYSIPYRDGLTAINRMVLEACVEGYTLTKFIATQTSADISITSHIDAMLKTCNERLSQGTVFDSEAAFDVHDILYPEPAPISLTQDDVQMLATSFNEAMAGVELAFAPVQGILKKVTHPNSSALTIQSTVAKTHKRSIEQFADASVIGASVDGTNKIGFIHAEVPVPIHIEMKDLFYRLTTAADTAFQIAAVVTGTELHYSLGNGMSSLILDIDAEAHSRKYETVCNVVSALAELTETVRKFMEPTGSILLHTEASAIVKRHRLLSEMDEDSLENYDDMTLDDVYYVIL